MKIFSLHKMKFFSNEPDHRIMKIYEASRVWARSRFTDFIVADPVAKYIILHVDESRKQISNLNIDPLQFQEACSMPAYACDLQSYDRNVTSRQLQMC